MNFSELARARYSVRAFQQKEIRDEDLNAILEAGRVAPTACNNQPQKIYVVKSPALRQKLAAVCPCTFDAPTVIVMGYDKTRDWKNRRMPGYSSGETDAAIVCTHMMLAAFERGVGSCWVGVFNAEEVANTLGLPENVRVTSLLPIGYPADGAKPLEMHSQYRDLDDTVTFL
ncbi:MAG: nitroreductase family protein [Clostridia bacterium]|nr:nitroreductase family protein [Clostridia bacterium]